MKKHDLLTSFIKFTSDLKIDNQIKEIIKQTVNKNMQSIKIQIPQPKKVIKQTKQYNFMKTKNKENTQYNENKTETKMEKRGRKKKNNKRLSKNLNAMDENEKKLGNIEIDPILNKDKEQNLHIKDQNESNILNKKNEKAINIEKIIEDTKQTAFENEIDANYNIKLSQSEGLIQKKEFHRNTRKSAFIANNAFKACEELDKELNVTRITKLHHIKPKRKRICMPKSKPKKNIENLNKSTRSIRQIKLNEKINSEEEKENKEILHIENTDKPVQIEQTQIKLENPITIDHKKASEKIIQLELSKEKISKHFESTISKGNLSIRDAFKNLKTDIYNQTKIEAKKENPLQKKLINNLEVKKDRSIEDIKKEVEILMPKTTYLFKDEYTRVENLVPKRTNIFGKRIFNNVSSNLHRLVNNPNHYVSKTKIENIGYNDDFDMIKGPSWTRDVDHMAKNQKDAIIEKLFKVEGPVDVISMFPDVKSASNDSPNKFVKRF